MLDILFSHSYYYPLDQKQWNNKTPYPPLGTIYAASLLRKSGFSVSLFDTNLRDNPFEIEKEIQDQKPSFLVIYDDGFNSSAESSTSFGIINQRLHGLYKLLYPLMKCR